jgi:tripartite-type tricarboxylate transporter receptor subunit TctC
VEAARWRQASPDFGFETYTALMAPAKTPPEIVARLEKSALEILAKPDMREKRRKPASR